MKPVLLPLLCFSFLFSCSKDNFKGDIVSGLNTQGDLIIQAEIAALDTNRSQIITTITTRATAQLYYSQDSFDLNIPLFENRQEVGLDSLIRIEDLTARNYILSCKLDSIEQIESIFIPASAISYSFFTF